jgi:hypothetical protein
MYRICLLRPSHAVQDSVRAKHSRNDTVTLATVIISLETLDIDNMMEEEAAVAEFFERVQALASIEGNSFSYMEIQRMVAGDKLLLACKYN